MRFEASMMEYWRAMINVWAEENECLLPHLNVWGFLIFSLATFPY